jgi:predicted O-methyltransferase YrrM
MPADETLNRHLDTWLEADKLGTTFPEYRSTYPITAQFIDADQARFACSQGGLIDIGIPGWLRPADALKLYEMAYFSRADTLELGSYQGLSTSVMAAAVQNAGSGRHIISLELDPLAVEVARRHTAPWTNIVTFMVGDARESCRSLIDQHVSFGFAFIDHSHTYDLVLAACNDLKSLLSPGGFALFHDFNDGRNGIDSDYGVWQAVRDSFSDGSFDFYGIYGCTGLWRRVPVTPVIAPPPSAG